MRTFQTTPPPLLLASLLLLLMVLFCSNSNFNSNHNPVAAVVVTAFTSTPFGVRPSDAKLQNSPAAPAGIGSSSSATTLTMTTQGNAPPPSTFRQAEVLGLKLMQEQKYEEALKAFQSAMKLPGSKSDIVRTKSLSGPSPVGGAFGGTESKSSSTLDEFELQAANYNMACAHAQLDQTAEAVSALERAFQAGFDNFATVREDPDLDSVKASPQFEKLMQKYEPKSKGFNPFGLFGK